MGCYSCLATSDDGGATWRIAAAAVTSQEGSREASLVQLPASSHPGAPGAVIYVTQRNMGATPGHRWHSVSLDSGSSLSLFGEDPGLPDVDTKNWTVRWGAPGRLCLAALRAPAALFTHPLTRTNARTRLSRRARRA